MPVRKHYQYGPVTGIKVGRLNQGVNTQFIVYHIQDALIDTGPSNQWKHVKPFIESTGARQLLLTHHHEDHAGNAESIAKTLKLIPKAPKLAHKKLKSGYATPFFQRLVWGRLKPVSEVHELGEKEFLQDGSEVIPVHTPGHAKDLTVFYLPKQKFLFSGDLFIANRLKMLRSDENLYDLLSSLKKALVLDFEVMFCPHGGVIENGKAALKEKYDHIIATCQQAQAEKENNKSLEDVTQKVLGDETFIGKLSGGNFCKANLVKQALDIPLADFTGANGPQV